MPAQPGCCRAVLLALLVAVPAAALAPPAAWLGFATDPMQTTFCRTYGCRLLKVERNSAVTMGWFDGTRRTYRLQEGARLEVEVRPAGWISTARLMFPAGRGMDGWFVMTPTGHRVAAEFLSVVTGRAFSPDAVAACERAGERLANPDATSPVPLSVWTTRQGLPYRARCGVRADLGVWAGWQQQ